MTTKVQRRRCFPSTWPAFSDVPDPLFGLVFTTPRLEGDENTRHGLSRLVVEATSLLESDPSFAQNQWVVDAYVWLTAVTRPGQTRALLARKNAVWSMLEGWGVHLPDGERYEVDTSDQDDTIRFAGGLRFPVTSFQEAIEVLAFEGAEESVMIVRQPPTAPLHECLASLTEARSRPGGVRAEGAMAGIVLFGGESEDHRSFELYAVSSQGVFISALLDAAGPAEM